jgi:hypothetical protein
MALSLIANLASPTHPDTISIHFEVARHLTRIMLEGGF